MNPSSDACPSPDDQSRLVRGARVLSADAFEAHIATELGIVRSEVRSDARLIEDLRFDSLQMLELALVLDAMGAHLGSEDLARITRIGDVYRLYVDRRTLSHYGELSCERGPDPWPREAVRRRGASTLASRRTRQRQVVPGDYPYLYDLARADSVATHWRHRGRVMSPEQFIATLWQDVIAQHIILDGMTAAPVGLVTAYDADLRNGLAYLDVALDPSVQGRGWPLEAVALFVEHLFRRWPLRKLYAEALGPSLRNVASGLGKLFVEEGRLSGHEYVDGTWLDLHILSVSRERWEADATRLIDDVTGATSVRPVGVPLQNGHSASG